MTCLSLVKQFQTDKAKTSPLRHWGLGDEETINNHSIG